MRGKHISRNAQRKLRSGGKCLDSLSLHELMKIVQLYRKLVLSNRTHAATRMSTRAKEAARLIKIHCGIPLY